MDTWLAPFKMNMVCFDKHSKEFVRISNGKCVLDHSSPEAFKAAHVDGCVYVPHEATALRVVGATKTRDPIIGYTYRAVNVADLTPCKDDAGFISPSAFRPSRFVGRV